MPIPILTTKLHPPPIRPDILSRPQLLERLNQSPRRSVILVSAPAGYGKSTVVASWLQHCERHSAWLTLDERDDDLQRFLGYFVAAVQTISPEALCDTAALIKPPVPPPMPVLAATLINELDQIEQDSVVVLDDVHCIQDRAIHGLLSEIMREPPRSVQMVLISRRDPMLLIASLRAKGSLLEFRMRDLRFTTEEAAEFLQRAIGRNIDASTVAALTKQSEGWVTGLHLAVMAMRSQDDPGGRLVELRGSTRYVVEYLLSEVLGRQPAGIRNGLLSSSILDRFSVGLCDTVFASDGTSGEGAIDGQAFIDWLQMNSLFIINLDAENQWFRYHQLFRELLRTQLNRIMGAKQIATLHSRASAWCEAEGLIEESIHYALAAGDDETAADIVERHRDAEFDANKWYVVDRWLSRLPDEVKQRRPKLLLTQARVLNDRFRLMEIPPIVERAKALLEAKPGSPLDQGELLYFLGFLSFWEGDGRNGRAFLDRALELIPEGHVGYMRAQIELFFGLTTQISGRKDEAIEALSAWIEKQHPRTGIVWERLRFGLAVVYFLGSDLAPAYRDSRLLRDDAKRNGQTFVETWGEYLLGIISLHRHELEEARQHFDQVVNNKYVANHRAAIDSMVGNAIASEFLGQPEDADQSIRLGHDYAQWTEDEAISEVLYSGEARIAVLRGEHEAAIRWQRGYSLPGHVPSMIFFLADPNINQCRVLAAAGGDAELTEAAGKLQRLRKETEAIHYTCQTIEIIALQAMVAARQDRPKEALDLLEEVVVLAEPGGWIRPFVELGSAMADLLQQLLESDRSAAHAGKILASFRKQQPRSIRSQPLSVPLTWREQEILDLLAKRLQNKEISEQLHISPVTVKSHLRSIYQKLNVRRRREAVGRAEMLGLLTGQRVSDQG